MRRLIRRKADIINPKLKSIRQLAHSEAFGACVANAVVNPIVALFVYPVSRYFTLGIDLISDTLITCIVLSVCVAIISPFAAKKKIAQFDKHTKPPEWTKFIPFGNFKRGILTGTIFGIIFCTFYAVYFYAFRIETISFFEFESAKIVYTGLLGYFAGLSAIYAQFKNYTKYLPSNIIR